MRLVSSREIRVNPRPVFEAAEGGDEVVITSRGKPVALLVGVDGDDLEETLRLLRRAKAAQVTVSRMRKAAAREGSDGMSREEIEAEIAATRSELPFLGAPAELCSRRASRSPTTPMLNLEVAQRDPSFVQLVAPDLARAAGGQ